VLANHIPVLTEHFKAVNKFGMLFVRPFSFINSFLSRSVILVLFIFLFSLVLEAFKFWVPVLELASSVAFVIEIYPYRV
jgi:hypothetical protein